MSKEDEPTNSSLNPFAPPLDAQPSLAVDATSETEIADREITVGLVLQSLAVWLTVCVLSAGPSFGWGMMTLGQNQILAMCTGVLIFVVAYTVADVLTCNRQWRRDPRMRNTLRIGYISRMIISVVFPLGGMLDMFCGAFSIRIVGTFTRVVYSVQESAEFGIVLVVTLVQGVILNIVLIFFMSFVYLIQSAMRREIRPRYR